jgi:hypothetical protein
MCANLWFLQVLRTHITQERLHSFVTSTCSASGKGKPARTPLTAALFMLAAGGKAF